MAKGRGKKDDWIPWALGGAGLIALYLYITNQKAGAPMQQGQGIAVGEPNPSAPKEGGCGCEMEPEPQSQPQAQVASTDVTGVPSTG